MCVPYLYLCSHFVINSAVILALPLFSALSRWYLGQRVSSSGDAAASQQYKRE